MNVDSCSSFKLFRNASKLSLKRVFVFFPLSIWCDSSRETSQGEKLDPRGRRKIRAAIWSMTSVQVSSTLSLSVARIFTACFSTMTRLITARLTIQLITVGASTHPHTLCSSLLHLSLTHIYTARWLSQWTLAFGTACPLWLVAVGNWLFTITLWGYAVDREAVITYALPPRHRLYPAQSDFPLELFLASSENSDDGARRQNEFVCSQGGEVNYFHPSQTYTKQTSKKKKMWVCFWVSYFLVV